VREVTPPGLVDSILATLGSEGVDVPSRARAWARMAPVVATVPAFGLRALPGPARMAMGLLLAIAIAPAVAVKPVQGPWVVALAIEAARGVPLAISASVPLWAATSVGGAIDALRGAQEGPSLAIVDGKPTPLGGLFAMLASLAFLASGGPARVALAVASADTVVAPLARAAQALTSGITIAVAIAAPIIAAALVIEVALALLARAATPTNVQSLTALGRGVAVLGVLAILFERVSSAVTTFAAR
jgi:type III secretory pathway component EscT